MPAAGAPDDIADSQPTRMLRPQATVDDVIAWLQRAALADRQLRALAPEQELRQRLDEAARALWTASRVKAFVPVLAMRQLREDLRDH